MKAIILAAGYGNRMRPLTDSLHKTLLTVGGKTIIGRIIESLLLHSVNDIVVVTGYRRDEIERYLRDNFPRANFTFIHNDRFRETNNIYSMALAFNGIAIDGDIILIESDLIYEPSLINRAIASPYRSVALVDKYRSGMDGTVVTVENGIITSVIPPHLQSENFDFSDKYKTLNIYKFSRDFCETSFKRLLTYYADVIDANCYYELILGILVYMQKETIHAEVLQGEPWAEVDDPNDLHVAEFIFKQHRKQILSESMGGYWNYDILDFCFIRNMYFPTTSMISELKSNLHNLLHNYGSRQELLNRKMSWFLLCDEKRVQVLNGASQIYPLLRRRYADARTLIPAPSFGEYARIFPDATVYRDEIGFVPADIQRLAEGRGLVVFVNPNNPTGSTLDTRWIFDFARANPSLTCIVDESFIEFADVPSIIPLLEQETADNVIVIKSLSKSLGVPGMRLGYSYTSSRAFNEFLSDNLPIWGINSLAEFMLKILLKYRKDLAWSIEQTRRDRTAMLAELAAVSIIETAYPSGGNFVLAALKKTAPPPDSIVEALLADAGIYVKDVTNKFSNGNSYLRFAVRLPEENMQLVNGLKKLG